MPARDSGPSRVLPKTSKWNSALSAANSKRDAINAFKTAGSNRAKRVTSATPTMDPAGLESGSAIQTSGIMQTTTTGVLPDASTSLSPTAVNIYLADIGSSRTLGILDQTFIPEMVSLMGSYVTTSRLNVDAQMIAGKTGVNVDTILKVREAIRNSTHQSHGAIPVPLGLLSQTYLAKNLKRKK